MKICPHCNRILGEIQQWTVPVAFETLELQASIAELERQSEAHKTQIQRLEQAVIKRNNRITKLNKYLGADKTTMIDQIDALAFDCFDYMLNEQDLLRRIAELEAMLPKWHPYPAEKPWVGGEWLILLDGLPKIAVWTYGRFELPNEVYPTFQNNISYWAELPAPPKKEAK